MSSTEDILAAIAQNLAQPKRARTDAGEVEQHDLDQQIAAAKFAIAMSGVSKSPFRALRQAQLVMGNATNAADPNNLASVYPPPGMSGSPGYWHQ